MTNQDKLKKLAGMAGKETETCLGRLMVLDYKASSMESYLIWNPLEDMNQALEVWRAKYKGYNTSLCFVEAYKGRYEDHYSCVIEDLWVTGKGNTEAEALCNAMLAIKDGE
jgi:hypothetical protein